MVFVELPNPYSYVNMHIVRMSTGGLVMPRRTLYVREEDQVIWQKAEALADTESLSALVTEALRRFVLAKEQESGKSPYERIELTVSSIDPETNGVSDERTVAFTGRKLVSHGWYTVYETAKHQLLIYGVDESNGSSFYNVHKTFDDAAAARNHNDEPLYPPDLLAAGAEQLGWKWVEELDV